MNRMVFLLLIVYSTTSYSQVIPTKHYYISNGLKTSMVYYSILAEHNEMWFGTNMGLVKFNGYEFSDFSLSDGLTDTEIFKIEKSSNGNYWLLTNNGIPTIVEDGQFNNIDNQLAELSRGSFLWDFFETDSGNFWLGTQNNGIIQLSANNKAKSFFPDESSSCFKIWKSVDGHLYFALRKGIYRLKNKSFESVLTYPELLHRRFMVLGSIVYFSEDNNLLVYDGLNASKYLDTFSGTINFISKRDEESIWIGTTEALQIYHLSTSISEIYIGNINATSATQDHEQGLWVTTLNEGVFYYAKGQPQLVLIGAEIKERIDNLFLRNDDLIISSNNSLSYNLTTNKSSLENNGVKGKVNDRLRYKNKELIATTKGLYISEKKETKHLLSDVAVEDIEFINDSTMALVLSRHVLVVPLDSLDALTVSSNILEAISPFVIYQNAKPYVVEATRTDLWIGTVDGLSKYNLKNGQLEPLPSSLLNVTGTVNDILFDHETLWIGTSGNGIFEFILETELVTHHTSKTGLLSDFSQALKIDLKSKSIVSISSNGLDIKQGDKWLPIPLKIPVNDGRNSVCIVDSDYFISSQNQIFIFNPYQWIKSIGSKKINTIEFYTSNIQQQADNIGKYTFSHSQGDITVKFTSINYRLNELTNYEYVLFDNEDTVSSGSVRDRELQFPLLKAGKYKLSLWTVNPLTDKGPKSSVSFIVLPPFWQTWWFKALIALTICGIIYVFFKIRVLTYNRDIVRELIVALVEYIKRDKKIVLKDSTGNFVSFSMKELYYIKAAENYIEVNCSDKRHLVRVTMKKVETQLSGHNNFLRVHHSFIVNIDHAQEISNTHVMIKQEVIPVSRRKRGIINLPNTNIAVQ